MFFGNTHRRNNHKPHTSVVSPIRSQSPPASASLPDAGRSPSGSKQWLDLHIDISTIRNVSARMAHLSRVLSYLLAISISSPLPNSQPSERPPLKLSFLALHTLDRDSQRGPRLLPIYTVPRNQQGRLGKRHARMLTRCILHLLSSLGISRTHNWFSRTSRDASWYQMTLTCLQGGLESGV